MQSPRLTAVCVSVLAMIAITPANAVCNAGFYNTPTSVTAPRQYPPLPTAGSYTWTKVTNTVNMLSVTAGKSGAGYGLGTYGATASSINPIADTTRVGATFNYIQSDSIFDAWYPADAETFSDATGLYTGSAALGGVSGYWIYLSLPMPIKLTAYTIYVHLNAWKDIPQKWKVLASNDATTWTVVDTREYTTGGWINYVSTNAFPFTNPALSSSFTYYALVIYGRITGPYTPPRPEEWALTGTEGGDSYTCAACGTGTYSVGGAATVCSACTNGNAYSTYTGPGTTATNCPITCVVDSYKNGATCVACQACPAAGTTVTHCPGTGTSDTHTCSCGAGYYVNGAACTACSSTCPANSYLSSACSGTTTSDTSACTCNAGYYKSGSTCVACFECPEPRTLRTGTYCSGYGTVDTVRCDCGGNSYITGSDSRGLTCAWCAFCDHWADIVNWCDGYGYSSSQSCVCYAGYYGNGATCTACKTCAASATQTGSCPYGSATDTIGCQCNAGYYGNGVTCTACKTCSASATKTVSCAAGSTTDGSQCRCNAGYSGDGTTCTACRASCGANAAKTVTCPAGSATDVTVCSCNAGYYGNGLTCTACSSGRYATSIGLTSGS